MKGILLFHLEITVTKPLSPFPSFPIKTNKKKILGLSRRYKSSYLERKILMYFSEAFANLRKKKKVMGSLL